MGTGTAENWKPDKRALFRAIHNGTTAREAGRMIGIHPKRVVQLCEEFARLGLYEYGVVSDLGWLTPLGEAFL